MRIAAPGRRIFSMPTRSAEIKAPRADILARHGLDRISQGFMAPGNGEPHRFRIATNIGNSPRSYRRRPAGRDPQGATSTINRLLGVGPPCIGPCLPDHPEIRIVYADVNIPVILASIPRSRSVPPGEWSRVDREEPDPRFARRIPIAVRTCRVETGGSSREGRSGIGPSRSTMAPRPGRPYHEAGSANVEGAGVPLGSCGG